MFSKFLYKVRDLLDAVLVSPLDKVLLAKHLSTMIHAGIVLDEAVDILVEEASSPRLRNVLREVKRRIDRGEPLADALASRPAIFSSLFVEMIRVGEASGTLEENLLYIATQLQHDYELRRQIRGAAAYPTLVLLLASGMAIGVSYFILPKLIPLFTSLKVDLPLTTRMVLVFSLFITRWGYLFFPGLVAAFFLLRFTVRLPAVRPLWHRFFARLPLLGKVSVNSNLAQLTRTMGILLKSGLPIVEAIQITHGATRNENYRRLLRFAAREVNRGLPLSESMNRLALPVKILPVMVPRMIAVGERTGTLADSLQSLADFYEREVESATKNLSTIIEPALIIVIGIGVLILALAIISPIYKITGSLQPR